MDHDGRRRTDSPSCGSCPLQDALLAAGLSVTKEVQMREHGRRALTRWDGMDASLIDGSAGREQA